MWLELAILTSLTNLPIAVVNIGLIAAVGEQPGMIDFMALWLSTKPGTQSQLHLSWDEKYKNVDATSLTQLRLTKPPMAARIFTL